jgi:hypothetical protein
MMPPNFGKFFSVFAVFLFSGIFAQSQPVIIGHPADTSVCSGSRADFFVLAINATAYQWQENDGVGWYNIDEFITYASGYNTQILTINDANLGLDGYQYRCLVYDIQNTSAVSNPAILGVNEPPVITQHPINITVCKNEIARFSVTALNADSYQWQESVGQGWVNLSDNAFFSGTNTSELSIFTTTGMNGFRYRCRVINGNCPVITSFGRLFVNPTPTLQEVTGGGAFCAGGAGVEIGLASSESGITYQLIRDNIGTGIIMPGTGSALNLGRFSQPGIYQVRATNGATGCGINMLNTAIVSVNPLPLQQQLLGGGSFCEGSQAPEVFLLASQQEVRYELFRNGISTGMSLPGNGFALSFGNISETGYYTVRAENTLTNCSIQLNGNVQILQNAVPQVFAGNSQTINAGESTIIQAQATGGSGNYGFNWQPSALLLNPQSASTATIPLYQSRLFSVQTRDLISQCVSLSDSVLVFVAGGPLSASIVTSENAICAGTNVNLIPTVSGGSGNYTFSWSSTPAGYTSTSAQITVSPTETTNYHLQVFDGISSVSISVTITVFHLPTIYNITGGGSYCFGSAGREIGLSGSEIGVIYTLFRNGQLVSTAEGIGQAISFGTFNEAGVYTSTAKNFSSQCSRSMAGAVAIAVLEKPLANAGNNQYVESGTSVTLSGSASGGTGNYHYSWSPASLLINPNAANAASLPLFETKLFSLAVTDQVTACKSNPSEVIVFVTGNTQVTVDLTASSYLVCPGESVQLLALASGGTGNYEYYWESTPAGFQSSIYNPLVTPSESTKYKVTVTNGFITASDSVTIQTRELPQAYTLLGGGEYCFGGQGNEIYLTGSQTQTFYSLWCNGSETGQVRTGTGGVISFGNQTHQGIYEAKAYSLSSLCSTAMTGNPSIEVLVPPIVNAGNDVTIEQGTSVQLSATVTGGSGDFSFSWNPVIALVNPTAQTAMTLPMQQTLAFNVVATDNQSSCQSAPDEVIVFVTGSIQVTVDVTASSYLVCPGEPVQLLALASGGTGNYEYLWESTPSGFQSSIYNPLVTPSESTKYKVTVTDGFIIVSDSVTIQAKELPQTYTLLGGGEYCLGSQGNEIYLTGSQTQTLYSLWRNGSETGQVRTGTGDVISFGNQTQQGIYEAKAYSLTSLCSLIMAGNPSIEVLVSPIVNAGNDVTIEQGNSVQLSALASGGSGDFSFSWNPAVALVNPTAQTTMTLPMQQTLAFNVVATDNQSSCQSAPDEVIVFVTGSTQVTVDVTASSYLVCPGESVQLLALASGGTGNYEYYWESTPSEFQSIIYNPLVTPSESTKYKVTVTDGFIIVSDSVTIQARELPQTYTLLGGGEYCLGGLGNEIYLTGSQTQIFYSLWRNGSETGQVRTGTGGVISFGNQTHQGVYEAKAYSLTSLCSTAMTGNPSIEVLVPPIVNAGNDVTIEQGTSVQLSATAIGGSGDFSFSWNPAVALVNPTAQTTMTVPMQQTIAFTVVATANQSSCQSAPDEVIVFVTGNTLEARASAESHFICTGESVSLSGYATGGNGNYTFNWKSVPSGFYSWEQNAIAVPVTSTKYVLTVTDGIHTATDTVFVQVNELPQIFSVSGGGNICQTGSVLPVGLSGSQTAVFYSLRLNGDEIAVIIGTGNPISFGLFNASGTYTVYASFGPNGCGRTMAGNAVITNGGSVIASAGPDKYIFFDGQTTLEGEVINSNTTYTFSWSPANKLLNPNALQPTTVSLEETTLFKLEAAPDGSGCAVSEDYTAVFVGNGTSTMQLKIVATHDIVCPASQIKLFALPSGGSGNYLYSWTSEPAGFESSVFDPVVFPEVSTKYKLVVNDGISLVYDSVYIAVNPAPVQFQFFGGGIYCQGSAFVNLGLSGSEIGIQYVLHRNGNPTGNILSGTGGALQFNGIDASGLYTVMAENPASQCVSIMTGEAQVQLYQPPLVLSSADQSIGVGESALLSAVVSGGSGFYNYQWIPPSLLLQPNSLSSSTFPLQQSTVFLFSATDLESGCQSNIDSTIVTVTGGQLLVNIIASSQQVCHGEAVILSAFSQGGNGANSYEWKDSNGVLLGTAQTIQLNPTFSQTFYLSISDGEQMASAEIFIEVGEIPLGFQVTGGGAFCASNTGISVGLSNSEIGLLYTLYRNYTHAVSQVVGQGGPINFGLYNISGNYTVKATRPGFGCETLMAGSALIQQFPLPFADAGENQSAAFGSSAQLNGIATGGTGSYIYNWEPSSLLINSSAFNPQTVPLSNSTLFNFTVTDQQSGCQASDQTIVFVSGGALSVNISTSDFSVCPGQLVQLTALPQGGSGNYTWSWTAYPPISQHFNPILRVYPQQTTKYFVSVFDGFVHAEDSVIVTVLPLPQQFEITGSGFYCPGEQFPDIGLSGSQQGVSYALLRNGIPAGLALNGTGSQISFGSISSNGTYSVVASNQNGCTLAMSGTIQIQQSALPVVYTLLGGGAFCANEATAGLYLSGSEANVAYQLKRDNSEIVQTLSGTGQPLAFTNPSISGNYHVEAFMMASNCSKPMQGTVSLLVFPVPQVIIEGENQICHGESVYLEASGGSTYSWQTEPPVSGSIFTIVPESSASYTVTASNEFGCSSSQTAFVEVVPMPSFSLRADAVQQILFVEEPNQVHRLTFMSGNTILQDGMSMQFFYGNTHLFNDSLTVEAIGLTGCKTKESILILGEGSRINAFSPNSDNINDRFMQGSFIRLYNRWGLEIFVGTEGWDGKYKGTMVAPGTYYYIHEIKDVNGMVVRTDKGSVTLVKE